jgi:hypothetical protein
MINQESREAEVVGQPSLKMGTSILTGGETDQHMVQNLQERVGVRVEENMTMKTLMILIERLLLREKENVFSNKQIAITHLKTTVLILQTKLLLQEILKLMITKQKK